MKTSVKHWFGSSNDSSKAKTTEFASKKAAQKHIKDMRRHNKVHGHEMMGAANFYEIIKNK